GLAATAPRSAGGVRAPPAGAGAHDAITGPVACDPRTVFTPLARPFESDRRADPAMAAMGDAARGGKIGAIERGGTHPHQHFVGLGLGLRNIAHGQSLLGCNGRLHPALRRLSRCALLLPSRAVGAAVYMRPRPRVLSFGKTDHWAAIPEPHPMQRSKPPFRAEHVGSLIRPATLIEGRMKAEKGEISDIELKRIQHAAIRDVVRLQEELGLRVVTDGEYNRQSWHRDFMLKFHNVRMIPSKLTVRFHSAEGARLHSPPTMQVTGKLARPNGGGIFVRDFKFLASVARATPK